jgi:AraC-like DNA-binding protein
MEYLKTIAVNLINQRTNVIDWIVKKKSTVTARLKVNSKDEDFLQKLVAYIYQNQSMDLSIDNLADYCNVSRTVFYNKIKGLTGYSPIDFVRRIKMNSALQLIENGYNVSEAAFRTGFSDAKYFSRLFKAQYGYPPSKYKSET